MRILLVTDIPDTANVVDRMQILSEAVEVVSVIEPCDRLIDAIVAATPDILVIQLAAVDRFSFSNLIGVAETAPLPVIMLSDDDRLEFLIEAASAGVHAYASIKAGLEGFAVLVTWARAQFEATRILKLKLRDQEAKLADRIVIERAKGVVMKMKGLAEDTAYHEIRKMAMRRSLPMRAVAEQIIDTADLVMRE